MSTLSTWSVYSSRSGRLRLYMMFLAPTRTLVPSSLSSLKWSVWELLPWNSVTRLSLTSGLTPSETGKSYFEYP